MGRGAELNDWCRAAAGGRDERCEFLDDFFFGILDDSGSFCLGNCLKSFPGCWMILGTLW